MASVSKRGSRWCVRYRYLDELGVEREKRVSGFLSREDAMEAAKGLEARSNAGIDVNGDRQPCGRIMERWYAEHCASLAASTRAKYSDAIDRLILCKTMCARNAETLDLSGISASFFVRIFCEITARRAFHSLPCAVKFLLSAQVHKYNLPSSYPHVP